MWEYIWPDHDFHGVGLLVRASVLDVVDQFEPRAELERIPFLGRPVVLASQVVTCIFISDDKTHTQTYELPSQRLSRPEAHFAFRHSLKMSLRREQLRGYCGSARICARFWWYSAGLILS